MITCSKCHKDFPLELNRISKDSHIPCIYCGTECLVKLFDLQDHVHDEESGFKGLENIETNDNLSTAVQNESNQSTFWNWHFVIILCIFQILLILFVIGITKIETIEEEFPLLARMYSAINIMPRKTVSISDVVTDMNENVMIVTLKISNLTQKTELISDVEVILLDAFHNSVAVSALQPHMMIKGNSSADLKIYVPNAKDNVRYIHIYMNGKIFFEKKFKSE